jgi:catechol 2,3-dioxygenase-like lactoylglutathione lyase family enzyme
MLATGLLYIERIKQRKHTMSNFYSNSIDHLNIGVSDGARSRDFYVQALKPLGIELSLSIPPDQAEAGGDQSRSGGWLYGFATQDNPYKPFFWLLSNSAVGNGLHIAFSASSREQVDAFYKEAIAAGGVDNGSPGVRRYHDNYYGAFVRDPDGNNIEAVCHAVL